MKESQSLKAVKIVLVVDEGWLNTISEITSYKEYGEVCSWESVSEPFDYDTFVCDQCGQQWFEDEWLEGGKCPDGCDDE